MLEKRQTHKGQARTKKGANEISQSQSQFGKRTYFTSFIFFHFN